MRPRYYSTQMQVDGRVIDPTVCLLLKVIPVKLLPYYHVTPGQPHTGSWLLITFDVQ